MRYAGASLVGMASLVFLTACGGSGGTTTSTGPGGSGSPDLAIVAGDSQRVKVTDTLPADVVVRVTRDGQPIGDQLVDWNVVEANSGEPFVTTTKTNSDGTVRNRIVAGTWAWTRPEIGGPAHVEVRWVDQSSGEALADTAISYWVLPGPLAQDTGTFTPAPPCGPTPVHGGIPFVARAWTDTLGNPIFYRLVSDSGAAHIASADSSTADGRTFLLDDTVQLSSYTPGDTLGLGRWHTSFEGRTVSRGTYRLTRDINPYTVKADIQVWADSIYWGCGG